VILLPAVLLGTAPWSHRVALAAALVAPIPALVVLVVCVLRARKDVARPVMGEDAAALLEVRAALQAGRTLREALADVSPEIARLVTVGASTDALADAVSHVLGSQGHLAGAAVRLLDRAGGPAAPVIEELAAQATETMRVRRELRAAVAAPVLQGVIVGGAPLGVLLSLLVSGGFGRTFASSPAHAVVVSAGALLTVVGAAWVVFIVKRAVP
jgi:Flp pilus assembly protein TadB